MKLSMNSWPNGKKVSLIKFASISKKGNFENFQRLKFFVIRYFRLKLAEDLELESERLTPDSDLTEFDRHADSMIYTLNDHIKFMPRTPENDDLGEIRSFKKVGFRDNIAYSDEAVSSLEDSDYKRGTLDSGTTEEFDICNLPDVPLELDFDAPVPPARKSMFRVIEIISYRF